MNKTFSTENNGISMRLCLGQNIWECDIAFIQIIQYFYTINFKEINIE